MPEITWDEAVRQTEAADGVLLDECVPHPRTRIAFTQARLDRAYFFSGSDRHDCQKWYFTKHLREYHPLLFRLLKFYGRVLNLF